MKYIWQKYKIEISLFSLVFIIRAFYALFIYRQFGNQVFVSFSDATVYIKLANNIIHNHVFSEALLYPHLVPDAMRTPGYPLFLAFFQLFKLPYLFTILIQDILAGFVGVCLYRITLLLFNHKRVGIATVCLFAIDPTIVYWTNLLMSDHFAGVFFALFVFFFAKKRFGWAGALFAAAALTRPVFFYLFPICIVMLLYLYRQDIVEYIKKRKGAMFSVLKPILFFSFFFLVFVGPWMGRNYVRFGDWNLSSNGWMAIHFFISRPFSDAHGVPFSWPVAPESYYNFPGVEKMTKPNKNTYYRYEFFNHPLYKKHFFSMVRTHPVDYAVFHLSSSFKGFFKGDYDYLAHYVLLAKQPEFSPVVIQLFLIISYVVWYGLCLLALSTVLYKTYRPWAFFLLSFPFVNVLLTGPISAGSGAGRYNLPFFPFFIMLGVLGAFELYTKIKKHA